MKKFILIIFTLGCISSNAQVKIYTADSGLYSIENLARYFVGRGVVITNITFAGKIAAFGQFDDKGGSVGLKKGIILTTGKAIEAQGPNDNATKSTLWNQYSDDDLNVLASPNITNIDAAILAFDFIPLADTLKFRLVYGSEQYNFTNNTSVVNPLGIFLQSETDLTKRNIAKFSGQAGSTIINLQTIKPGGETNWGQNPTLPGVNMDFFVANTAYNTNIQYNGYTIPINIKEPVDKCKKYHIKIAIANSQFTTEDSGVLLEQAEFGNAGIASSVSISDSDTIFLCKGGAPPVLTVNGASALDFQWYRNDTLVANTSTSLTPSTSGEYKVMATVSGSCMWQDSVHMKIGKKFPVMLNANPSLVCKNQLVTLTGIFPSSVSGSNIQWSSDPILSFVENSLIQPVSVTGASNKFRFSVQSKGGCIQSDTVTVTRNSTFFTLNPTPNDTICLNSLITLKANQEGIIARSSSEIDTFSLVWKNAARIVVSTQPEFTITPKFSDIYQVNLTSNNGCTDSAQVRINVDSVSFIRLIDKSICPNQPIVLSTSGINIKSYSWRQIGRPGTISGANSITVSPTTTTGYEIKVSGNNNCTANSTSTVTISPLPVYQKSNDTTVCKGSSVNIFVTNTDSLVWKGIGETSTTFIYNSTAAKTFSFTTYSAGKCVKSDSISVRLFSDFVNTIVGANTLCLGKSLTLKALGASQNLWVNTNAASAQIEISPTQNTAFTFIGSNTAKCRDTTIIPIIVKRVQLSDPPYIMASQGGVICPEKRLIDTLYAPQRQGFTYQWQLGNVSIVSSFISVNKAGKYKLTIVDGNGCKVSDSISITIKCKADTIIPKDTVPIEFHIPNVFTPNGDGINEYFEISLLDSNSKIEIFNRWGTSVYQSTNYDNKWDADGMPDGLYYFYLETNKKSFRGWLQIVR